MKRCYKDSGCHRAQCTVITAAHTDTHSCAATNYTPLRKLSTRAATKPAVKALDPNTSLTIKAGQHTTIDPNVISEIRLGLGWQTNGEAIDLDAGNT
jgi:hypothetical protein